MRRSGKTTRAIDEAVQKLFNLGGIVIPRTSFSTMSERLLQTVPKEYPICVDPDYMSGRAQIEFLRLLKLRIRNEHPHVHLQEETPVIIFSVNGNSR